MVNGAAMEVFDRLLQQLHRIEFYGIVPHDDNRAADGVQLRQLFLEKEGQHALPSLPDGPCTMLEMLIGLSMRLEYESMDTYWYKTPADWFWFLIGNLGLGGCENKNYIASGVEGYVKEVCDTFLERRYKSDGKGGLFPLKNPKKDQKKVEIWYQMSAFIMENYPF
jgi:predicted acetyltransferase